ncbi:DUF1672 family protein [Listeria monocytogenes]|uniref:Putative lipoprotein n=1 Tax=Listeria monocytogenes serotype 4a (strain M7) TaxID=1030009 RepID=A0A0E0USG1_LISMM|nr:DUF1672 family protein [Listeria monocytogenes]ACK40942.1 lipoprotein, putative [Listeria monocytogenes HCC23]AEH91063.1 putative lipoprotein [Listeria monocytogenes M7]AKS52709.1 lipoprotein [Listeria monocytogenes]EAC3110115.1 DUF1672 family protein [Listeria monocytogenes]EAC6859795.1 DUF1672 family protein [Listeria monocytogenes]
MKKKIIGLLASLLLLGGCFNMNEKTEQEKAQEGTTPVEDYVDQGYSFVDGNKSAERVKKHEEEIKQVAIDYMKTKYKTDVKVNNVVPARNAAVVIVECEEPIQFTTSVVVGLILNKDEVGSAHEEEGEVEQAIVGGLYAKAFEKEFRHLDDLTEKLAMKNDLVGYNQEALDKTSPNGYQGKYYFVSLGFKEYLSVYNAYLNKQEISANELQALFRKDDPTGEKMTIALRFFMKEDKLPIQDFVDNIAEELLQESNLPKATYLITIYKNSIVNRVGLPDGENTSTEIFIK